MTDPFRDELDRHRQRGYNEGYNEGYRDGYRDGQDPYPPPAPEMTASERLEAIRRASNTDEFWDAAGPNLARLLDGPTPPEKRVVQAAWSTLRPGRAVRRPSTDEIIAARLAIELARRAGRTPAAWILELAERWLREGPDPTWQDPGR